MNSARDIWMVAGAGIDGDQREADVDVVVGTVYVKSPTGYSLLPEWRAR
ncbi:MAG: hypothetical protein NZ585_00235 [Chloracidobacterium sp.]|nr:hypothetical protein [Chloracidobacterium sp.]MDW8216566.1 hypothetical protein [Acidobacteriota bacterium]